MPAGGALTLFRIRGIRISVDYSWFLVLFLIIVWLAGDYYGPLSGAGDPELESYALAVISALAFFASILLHELGHAFVSIRNGIGISDITLWMFGGVARMTRDTDSPGAEFRIAIAGPVVTLLIAAACIAVGAATTGLDEFWRAMRGFDTGASGALTLLAWLAGINLLVLVFNLVPAFPLDGGRVARAIAWKVTGDRSRATRFAGLMGQGFAYLFMGIGVLLVIQGDLISGVWLGLIGFILASSARGAVAQTDVSRRIEGITVGDVMDADPVAIPEDTSVERAIDEYFLRYRWPWFPVVDAGLRLRGVFERSAADSVPEVVRESRTVGSLLEADADGTLRVRDDAPLESLLGNENLRRLGALPAVDADGRLRGVITIDQIGRALRNALGGAGGRPSDAG